MLQEIKDEILDTTGQSDTNPRYRIKDNEGNVLQDNVQLELKTPVTQEGTPLNKATIENIQGDLYTSCQYNLPAISYATGTFDGRKIADDWVYLTGSTSAKYTDVYNDTAVRITPDSFYGISIKTSGMADGNGEIFAPFTYDTSYWYDNKKVEQWWELRLNEPALLIGLNIATSFGENTPTACYFQASNDENEWTNLYTIDSTPFSNINLTGLTEQAFKYYRIHATFTDGSASSALRVTRFIPDFSGVKFPVFSIDAPLSSYDTNNTKIARMYVGAPYDIKPYVEPTSVSSGIPTMTSNKVTNEYGTWYAWASYSSTTYEPYKAFDGDLSTYWEGDTGYKNVLYIGNTYGWLAEGQSYIMRPNRLSVKVGNASITEFFGFNVNVGGWEHLQTITTSSGSFTGSIDLSVTSFYSAFALYTRKDSSGGPRVYNLGIIGTIEYGSYPCGLSLKSFKAYETMLKIGDLPNKLIKSDFSWREPIELLLSGNGVIVNSNSVSGQVSPIGSSYMYITVSLGFTPKMVIATLGNSATTYLCTPDKPVYDSSYGNVMVIRDGGFDVFGNWIGNSTLNYVAIK